MNKKHLAIAVAAAFYGSQAVAVDLYNEGDTTFSVGGHVSVGLGGSEEGETEVKQVSPRINVSAAQDIGNGFVADAKGEWALNYLEGGEETFTTRLGYIGVTHKSYGRGVVGTQWSPYYDGAGIADLPIAFANDFLYDDQGPLGTARAERMISYRNTYSLNEAGTFSFGLGWQGTTTGETLTTNEIPAEYDDRFQIALNYSIMGFGLNYAYNTGDVKTATLDDTALSHMFSANYGTYGDGLYVAVVYAMNEYMNNGLEESIAIEGLLAYALPSSLNLSVNYESVEDDKNNDTIFSQMALQAEYNFTPSFVGFAGYQFDLGNDINVPEDDMWIFGMRYYL
ncbi:porin [Photobacterium galatheae]|uniref:Membrane protein n=1 Tax=Photobacterium galatheae TaxID=1654360 RepID=A0A066RXN8_9GAMM|nr:porin [Photobacterium galatheae]KDM92467.1 membrane protein [Photobacterium galatheae]MCM0147946.1 porin [Photobacterium galatheae]